MMAYLLQRLARVVPVLIIVSIIVFILILLVPGDPVTRQLRGGLNIPPERIAELRHDLGLDRPYHIRYLSWAGGVLTGDWGESIISRQPVLDVILRRVPVTLELALFATLVGVTFGIAVGIVSALRQDTIFDLTARSIAIGGLSIPDFWLGVMVLLLPAIWWGWAPPAAYADPWVDPWKNLQQVWLVVLILSLPVGGTVSRMVRSTMLEVIRQDYVRTAIAKGLRQRTVIFRHAFRNALLPVITVLALESAYLLSGAVVMENIFALPGLGNLMINAVIDRDYPVIQGVVLFVALFFVTVNIMVDAAYQYLDPRLR